MFRSAPSKKRQLASAAGKASRFYSVSADGEPEHSVFASDHASADMPIVSKPSAKSLEGRAGVALDDDLTNRPFLSVIGRSGTSKPSKLVGNAAGDRLPARARSREQIGNIERFNDQSFRSCGCAQGKQEKQSKDKDGAEDGDPKR